MQIDEQDFISFITIKKNLAPQSIRHCQIRFRVVKKWLANRQLTKELVELFFLERKNSGQGNNSLNTYYFFFNQLQACYLDRGISRNFMVGFKSFKKTKPVIEIFTQQEIEDILNIKINYLQRNNGRVEHLDLTFNTFTMFLAFTGCRFSEVANLKVKDIDLGNGKASILGAKTYEFRTVYIVEPLISKLKKLMIGKNDNELIFQNSVGKQIRATDFSFDLKRRAKKAGVIKRVFPHNFRHTYITNLLETGVPITEVATLVGHKDIQTTYDTYMHLADQTLKNAAMRSPIIRKNVDPQYFIKNIKDTFKNYHLESDRRFNYEIKEDNDSLFISVRIVK